MSKIFIAKAVAYLIAFVAAVSSYGHQVHVLALAKLDPLFGLVPSEYITPATVDALAFIALVVRYADVSAAVRRAALVPLFLAGGMSVAANVAAAHNLVGIIVGVWTVAAYVIAEVFVSKLETKAAAAVQLNDSVQLPERVVTAPVVAESPEVLAYRAAAAQLRRESSLPALNGHKQ